MFLEPLRAAEVLPILPKLVGLGATRELTLGSHDSYVYGRVVKSVRAETPLQGRTASTIVQLHAGLRRSHEGGACDVLHHAQSGREHPDTPKSGIGCIRYIGMVASKTSTDFSCNLTRFR